MVCKWLKGKRVSRSRNALQLREGQDTLLLRLQNCLKRKEPCNSGYANTRRTKTVEIGLRIKKKKKKKSHFGICCFPEMVRNYLKSKISCRSARGIVWWERGHSVHMGRRCLREKHQRIPKGQQRGERGLLPYRVPSRILGVGVTEGLSVGNALVCYFWLSRRGRLAFLLSEMKYGGRQGDRHISWYFRAPSEFLMKMQEPPLRERSWDTSRQVFRVMWL